MEKTSSSTRPVLPPHQNKPLVIERPEKYGGNLSYASYESFESDFAAKKVHPLDVKMALAKELNILLEPCRKAAQGKEKLIKEAYPEE